ncbi:unnamed protein product [Effrenium voratum]|nr:unnamed protein product [Effrenium voratum]
MLGRLSDRFGRRTILLASLVGAGVANLGQACAGTYYQLLVWRAFSGVWAAVGNSAQVYLSDVCSPTVLGDYMSKLAAVPSLAMTFGPGLGGGLSKFGLNVPVLVDGALSLAAAALCWVYLPESPVWSKETQGGTSPKAAPKGGTSMSVKVLCMSGFFAGIGFGTVVSMTAIFLDAKLSFDSLHVGFTFVLSALATLATSIWGTSPLQKMLGLKSCAVWGSLLNGVFILAMAVVPGVWPTLLFLCLSRVAMTLRSGSNGTILTKFTDASNRGTVFAQQQFAMNMGRLVGPVVAGHLAVHDPVLLPWALAAGCSVVSALVLLAVQMPADGAASPDKRLLRGFTDLGDAAQLEYGSAEDCRALGNYVGDLLAKRRYRWVSRREAIYSMLDKLLPELSADAGNHREDLERLMKHVELIQKDFQGGVQCREC